MYDYHLNTPEIFLTKSMPPGDTFEINFNVSNDSQKQTIRSMVVDSDGVFILATDYDSYPFSTYLYKTKEMNTPPIISPVSDKQVESGEMIKINFFINDIDHNVNDLQLWVKSSNAALVSTDSILVTGSDQEKTLSITPGEGNIGFTTITIFLSDGENIVKENFTLEVFPKKESQIKITIENPDPGSPYIAPDSNSIVFKGSTAYAVTRVERVELMVSDGIQFLNKNDAEILIKILYLLKVIPKD
ncbi:hypothetical protein MHK_005253 [Candidatus Magnetomorum sp. HK-1]|nr:hypothetical protein MHK_005253 [Candidatus Magnetomorum sp. HK-1]